MKKEIIPQENNSYLLLDTNVIQGLTNAFLDKKKPKLWAKSFYQQVIDKKIQLLACDLTIFEFLRGSMSLIEYKEKLKLLEQLFTHYISGIETGDIIDATRISNLYVFKNACKNKVPEFTDLFLVNILKNLSAKNVVLATFNYKDFPLLFLEREIWPVDMGYEIQNLCFYRFNEKKYKENVGEFIKSSYHKANNKAS